MKAELLTKIKRINMFTKMKKTAGVNEDFTDWLIDKGFFTAPASTKFHGAYSGGLFDHCFEVTEFLVKFTEQMQLEWKHPRSPWIVGMFHDLCKIDQYEKVVDAEGVFMFGRDEAEGEKAHFIWNETSQLIQGHGDKSVMLLSQWLQLTEEEILCIRYHMGAYETKDWDLYDRAIRKYPNVLWTHTADMYAAKVRNV